MKFSGWMFAFLTGFYLVVSAIYNYMSHDVVGTTGIALLGGLSFLIAFYVLFTDKRVGDLPEDNPTANISDADSDYGFFSPHSWWPLVIGVGTSIFIMGFIFAVWLAIIGVGFLLFGIWGLIFEYYRGDFAH